MGQAPPVGSPASSAENSSPFRRTTPSAFSHLVPQTSQTQTMPGTTVSPSPTKRGLASAPTRRQTASIHFCLLILPARTTGTATPRLRFSTSGSLQEQALTSSTLIQLTRQVMRRKGPRNPTKSTALAASRIFPKQSPSPTRQSGTIATHSTSRHRTTRPFSAG